MIRVPKKATTGQWCSRALLLLCIVGVSTVVRGAEPDVGGQRVLWIDAEDFENYGGWTLDTHPAHFVNNGEVRLTKQVKNMWASDPEESMPQWIELTWDEPVTISTAYLTFDTELNYRKHDIARVPQCVRDYEIIAHVDGRWRVVASEEDNFQRRRIHSFPPVTTKRLRVNVDATNGDPSARIYEIRAYTTTAAIPCSTGIRAQAGTKASNVSGGGHGMDEEVLSQIPKTFQELVDRGQTSGVVTLVARNGEIASIDAVGWRFRNEEPLETTDVFWAASITKPFVAVAIMMLVDEGRLQLDDLVEDHIPEFKGQKLDNANRYASAYRGFRSSDGLPTSKHPLTVRNLLNHLDGLPVTTTTKAAKSIKGRALASAKNPLMWEPGSQWRYGGEGLHVAAYIVEKYSGMPYTEFLKTRILDPLGMEDTYFTIKDVPKSRSVPTHRKLENGKWEFSERQDFKGGGSGHYFAVDGGFFSTVEDLFVWYQMLLNGGEFGGVRYISENSVRELTRKQTGDVKNAGHGPGNFYGLGFQEVVEPQGGTAVLTKGSFGKGGSGGSATWVDPSTKTIYILLQNMYGGDTEIVISTFLNTAAAAIDTSEASTSDHADAQEMNLNRMLVSVPAYATFADPGIHND